MTTVTKQERVSFILSRYTTDVTSLNMDAVSDIMALIDPPTQWKPLEELTKWCEGWLGSTEHVSYDMNLLFPDAIPEYRLKGYTHFYPCERPEPPKESTS